MYYVDGRQSLQSLLVNNINHNMDGDRFGCMIYIWQPRYKFRWGGPYSRAAGYHDIFRRWSVKLRKTWQSRIFFFRVCRAVRSIRFHVVVISTVRINK